MNNEMNNQNPFNPEQPMYRPEPVVQPQPVVQPEPVVQPQPVIQPQPVVQPEPVVQPQPVVQPEPIVQPEPVVEQEDISDVANTTFDYNELYGTKEQDTKEENEDTEISIFKAHDIKVEDRSLSGRNVSDITPEFNTNALEGKGSDEQNNSSNEVLNNKELDKADTRRKIIFIVVFALILIIFVGFIFPAIKGYK